MKRILAFILSAIILCSWTANAAYSSDTAIVAKKTVHTISPGLVYSSSVELFGSERQEIYSFEYTPGSATKIVPAYGQYIYGFNSVGNLISSYSGEGRVVGGINTDFFITSTGIPLSCLVSNKEVISTCENRAAIGFDKDGNSIIGYPNLNAKLYSENTELPIAHINKVPAIWGMYLVTDTFYTSTKSSLDSIEIVFKAFDKEQTYKELIDNESDYETGFDENLDDTVKDENSQDIIPDDFSENSTGSEDNYLLDDSSTDNFEDIIPPEDEDEENNESISVNDTETEIDPEDKQDGEEPSAEEKEKILEKYVFTSENAEINSEIDVVVTDIFNGVQNSVIEKDTFVLCVPKEQFGHLVEGIEIGDEFTLSISSNEDFAQCENIFGAGSIIVKDGEFVPQSNDSIFYTKNPRTAAGIRPDGSVVFICVDGRRKNLSEGLTISELAEYLINAGCTYAVNFDGGGSTTFYAADIGEISSSLKNTPSSGSERRVADGMLFVNTSEPNELVTYASIYPGEYFVYHKDAYENINGKILFADENFYPMDFSEKDVYLSVNSEFGILKDNVFTPGGKTGKSEIYASVYYDDKYYDFNVGAINVVDSVNDISITPENSSLSPFDLGTNISLSAFINTIPVTITPYSAEWSIAIEKLNDEGEVILENVGTEYALIDIENMLFIPFIKGQKYYLTATIGDYSENIEIYVDEFPYNDMRGHWAAQTSYDMFKKGFITGEIDINNVTNFAPDRYMTRAEFCVVLARILGLEQVPEITEQEAYENQETTDSSDIATDETDITQAPDTETTANFADVPEWARIYVQSLYENGYIDSLLITSEDGSLSINASEFITRNDVIRTLGALIGEENEKIQDDNLDANESETTSEYPDYIPENDEDLTLFNKVINSEIISGYEDGTIRQHLSLTRAEAATVFSRFFSVFEEQTSK